MPNLGRRREGEHLPHPCQAAMSRLTFLTTKIPDANMARKPRFRNAFEMLVEIGRDDGDVNLTSPSCKVCGATIPVALRSLAIWILALPYAAAAVAENCEKGSKRPGAVRIGNLHICPSGFFETIGALRSASVNDSVSTAFEKIPLVETRRQTLGTIRHSRLMLRTGLPKPKAIISLIPLRGT